MDKALQALMKQAKSFQDIQKMNLEDLKTLIRPAGYFNQKAAYLKAFARFLAENKMEKKPSRSELLTCKGVGPETADAILLYAFDQASPVVDTYTRRVLARVLDKPEYLSQTKYATLQKELMDTLLNEPMQLRMFHTLLIIHSQAVCHKLKPECNRCHILSICEYGKRKAKRYD